MARGLLDTSVFVALETGRPIEADQLPEESVISPITLGELQAGVLVADTVEIRAVRMNTVQLAAEVELIAIDERVAASWALLRNQLGRAGRRVPINDLWIAATGLANKLPVYTQDNDFDPLDETSSLKVIRV